MRTRFKEMVHSYYDNFCLESDRKEDLDIGFIFLNSRKEEKADIYTPGGLALMTIRSNIPFLNTSHKVLIRDRCIERYIIYLLYLSISQLIQTPPLHFKSHRGVYSLQPGHFSGRHLKGHFSLILSSYSKLPFCNKHCPSHVLRSFFFNFV